MTPRAKLIFPLTVPFLLAGCSTSASAPSPDNTTTTTTTTRDKGDTAAPAAASNELRSLHVRLTVHPKTGDVTYFGWYDGRRNLLGQGGVTTAIVGIEPPELDGELTRVSDTELLFRGIDQSRIAWTKRYRLQGDDTVRVTHVVTSRRGEPFPCIVYSLADLPDATIAGDNRDQQIKTPTASAHFHATISDPHFPGEQMNPYALRSDSKTLDPGETMTFEMTWRLAPP
jgi:hypothetical protein